MAVEEMVLMSDLEKVIQGLEHCGFNEKRGCVGCPYSNECGDFGREAGTGSLCTDALAILKEQESVKPEHGFPDLKCSNCGTEFVSEVRYYLEKPLAEYYKYCPGCGREVDWNA